ncbi:MAG: hypothetical protein WCI11_15155 [Candidatus Methylumidiphilus sp.]
MTEIRLLVSLSISLTFTAFAASSDFDARVCLAYTDSKDRKNCCNELGVPADKCGTDNTHQSPISNDLSKESDPTIQSTSYSQIGKTEDSSWAIARRFTSRIVIPLGRSREEVKATLERAAKELMKKTNADAIMVFAYRLGDPTTGMYSAGQAIYAPNGKWGDAATNSPKKISIDINNLYFALPDHTVKTGDTISLQNSTNTYVYISTKYGSWHDIDIVARVPNGTKAIILERKFEPIGEEEFVRYRIRTIGSGTNYEGWVHKSDTR